MTRRLPAILLALSFSLGVFSQTVPDPRVFNGLCDSLRTELKGRTSVDQVIRVNKITRKGKVLDLNFTTELSYYPFHQDDIDWFRARIGKSWDNLAKGFQLGKIITNHYEIGDLASPLPGDGGGSSNYKYAIPDPRSTRHPFISRIGDRQFSSGLSNRYIALWQSHGRYYDDSHGVWQWQRACVNRTVEDMFTQSFVIPYLIPMLENSGAYVMTPRERDINWMEIITDNDKSFPQERTGRTRREGIYSEKGRWNDAGTGFADFKEVYKFSDNPFRAGTARMAKCSGEEADASARWTPVIEKRGEYAVYSSDKTVPKSTTAAHYTVHHYGGDTEFLVNQKWGGGTWIYLGTFDFNEGEDGYITLDNRGEKDSIVTADAVKVGGGIGKLERGGSTSGMASSAEGASYWMQWSGVDSTITRNWKTDYTNDFAARGLWTEMMTEEKQIPFDLSLAFHTDAGVAPGDSTIGTLAIYTLRSDGEREFSDGRDRIISRLLCDYVQTQVVNDIRADFDPKWSRRGLWDRSYSETRTTGVPSMILELLSHQNFADMKYGLDPAFRFTVCRAVYKGILKTLSEYYNCPYKVQPLPVNSFAAIPGGDGKVMLKWSPTPDSKEPTAVSTGYIIYTRIDGGDFDSGVETTDTTALMPVSKGHIYSYKVSAFNDGGRSFPSEILSVGFPEVQARDTVLIVNNFDRVSAPAWVDTPAYAGFDGTKDSGVPYKYDISFIGDNYDFDRNDEYIDDNRPGFGASYDDHAGEIIAGNTFDFPYVHGKSIMAAGYAFYSMSRDAFCRSDKKAFALDIICGKQGRTKIGRGAVADRYAVFPKELQSSIRRFTAAGGNVLLSGSNIASDCQDDEQAKDLIIEVLGYKLATPFGTRTGLLEGMEFSQKLNSDFYCVECPDGIMPAGHNSKIWLRYKGSRTGAAIYSEGSGYKTVSIGVPIEIVKNEEDRNFIIKSALDYFDGRSKPVNHR